jgi:hypothetical protein
MACFPSGKWRAFQAAEPLGTVVVGGVTVHVSFADVLFKLKTRVGSKSGFYDFLAFRYDFLKEVSHVLIHLSIYLCALLRRT